MTIRYTKEAAESGGEFERLKPGTYLCQVEDVIERQSSKGDPMISLRFRSVEHGVTICFDNLVFSPKATGIAHKKLKMLGYPLPEKGEEFTVEPSDLIGLEVNLTLVEAEYQGKKNLAPDFTAEGFGYTPAGTNPKPKAAAPKVAAPPSSDDDDIPPF